MSQARPTPRAVPPRRGCPSGRTTQTRTRAGLDSFNLFNSSTAAPPHYANLCPPGTILFLHNPRTAKWSGCAEAPAIVRPLPPTGTRHTPGFSADPSNGLSPGSSSPTGGCLTSPPHGRSPAAGLRLGRIFTSTRPRMDSRPGCGVTARRTPPSGAFLTGRTSSLRSPGAGKSSGMGFGGGDPAKFPPVCAGISEISALTPGARWITCTL